MARYKQKDKEAYLNEYRSGKTKKKFGEWLRAKKPGRYGSTVRTESAKRRLRSGLSERELKRLR